MALGRCRAVGLVGLSGHVIDVEADVADGLPAFVLVGLPDTSLTESRDRVRAALANADCPLPSRRITVNLSPAAIPKTGSGFDLAVAASLLSACERVPAANVAQWVHLGELGLDGTVRAVRGALPAVLAAVRAGHHRVLVAAGNAREAALVPGAEVVAVRNLRDVVAFHQGYELPAVDSSELTRPTPERAEPDLVDVVGQTVARQALEVAAAGGHHLMLIGPPGSGKTMLAARLPSLLPDLSDEHAMEVTALHSIAGTLDVDGGLIRRPPFHSPHHTCTSASMVGGGSGLPRPGSASLAHRGVLFLDEAPEFGARVLDTLRQPLEAGELTLHRAKGSAKYPARFQLVLAANPCPCGRYSGKGNDCSCPSLRRRTYMARLSGPLLDRVDLQIEVAGLSRLDMLTVGGGESSSVVRERVVAARTAQAQRLAGTPWSANGEVAGTWLTGAWRLPGKITASIDRLMDTGRLTARGYHRLLRIAWTISDLEGTASPTAAHVDTAATMRGAFRKAA